jgi:PII-like signaling protein
MTPSQKKLISTYFPELGYQEDRNIPNELLIALVNKIQTLKGEDGYTPVKGKDYWTDEELNQIIDSILKQATPIKGVHYDDGIDGENYILTTKDIKKIANSIPVPIVEKVIEKTEVIKEVLPKLDVSMVKGALSEKDLETREKKVLDGMALIDGRIKLIDQRWGSHGGGLKSVSTDSTLTGLGTPASPLSVLSTGSGLNKLTFTGAVDGSNQTFNASGTVVLAILDGGRTLQKVSSTGVTNWSGTSNITFLTDTPTFDLILQG